MPEIHKGPILKDQKLANLYNDLLDYRKALANQKVDDGTDRIGNIGERMIRHLLVQQSSINEWLSDTAKQNPEFKGKFVVGVYLNHRYITDPERIKNVRPENQLIMSVDLINHYGRSRDKNWQKVELPASV